MKKLIKKILNTFGLNLSKFNAINVPAYQTALALKEHKINVVLDVGANIGQFASELRAFGYTGKIVSFEPLPEAYLTLTRRALHDNNWFVHDRCALGATVNSVEINVSENSVSSSVLPMLKTHEKSSPQSKYTHKETVPLMPLDDVFKSYCSQEDNVFLKIDTQGYEWAVLDGAKFALNQCRGVLLELSLIPLYEGQKLWLELISRLAITGHEVYAVQPGFTDQLTGETLQIDGLFFTKKV